jgi:hypothetical protein
VTNWIHVPFESFQSEPEILSEDLSVGEIVAILIAEKIALAVEGQEFSVRHSEVGENVTALAALEDSWVKWAMTPASAHDAFSHRLS